MVIYSNGVLYNDGVYFKIILFKIIINKFLYDNTGFGISLKFIQRYSTQWRCSCACFNILVFNANQTNKTFILFWRVVRQQNTPSVPFNILVCGTKIKKNGNLLK